MALEKDYRDIMLPASKTKLTIRGLKPYDYTFTGIIPDTFAEWQRKANAAKAQGAQLEASFSDFSPAEVNYIAKVCERAVVKVHQAKATDPIVKLTAKQPMECGPLEFSFFDLKADDVNALVRAVWPQEGGAGDVPAAFLQPKA